MPRRGQPHNPQNALPMLAVLTIALLALWLHAIGCGSNTEAPPAGEDAVAHQAPQTPTVAPRPMPTPRAVEEAPVAPTLPVVAPIPRPPEVAAPFAPATPPPPAPKALTPPEPPKADTAPAKPRRAARQEAPADDSDLAVLDAAIGTSVERRQLAGVADAFALDVGKVWAWVKIKNRLAPTHVTMVWKRDGEESWRIDLNVGVSAGWRTWSWKRIRKWDAGHWTVEVLSEDGDLLETIGFDVEPTVTASNQGV